MKKMMKDDGMMKEMKVDDDDDEALKCYMIHSCRKIARLRVFSCT